MTVPADPPAPPTGTPPAAPPAIDVSKIPQDLLALVANPDAFKARLAEAQTAGGNALAKSLGFDKVDDLKATLEAGRKAADANKTELQRATEALEALKPKAAQADALVATVATVLKTEEDAIPADRKGLLDLAPTDPAARLAWIATAKARGLFATPGAPPPPAKKPAQTAAAGAAGNAPAAAPGDGKKQPSEMTDQEFRLHKATWLAQRAAGGGQPTE